jgi:hypothetical protein
MDAKATIVGRTGDAINTARQALNNVLSQRAEGTIGEASLIGSRVVTAIQVLEDEIEITGLTLSTRRINDATQK